MVKFMLENPCRKTRQVDSKPCPFNVPCINLYRFWSLHAQTTVKAFTLEIISNKRKSLRSPNTDLNAKTQIRHRYRSLTTYSFFYMSSQLDHVSVMTTENDTNFKQ